MLQNFNLQNILKAIECGDIDTGNGLNQVIELAKPGQTRWGSHYKSGWSKIRAIVLLFESFDFVFSAHLMVTILGYIDDLSLCLQRRE
jgi:hypothetical protein